MSDNGFVGSFSRGEQYLVDKREMEEIITQGLVDIRNAKETAVSEVNSAGGTQVGLVEGAGTQQVNSVNGAGTTQVGNVTTEGNNQVTRVQQEGASYDVRIGDLEGRVTILERKCGKKYGVRRRITGNTSSAWERIGDAVGLIANAQIGNEAVINNFDDIFPWCDIKDCNVDSNGDITHFIGEVGFTRESEVYVYIPKHWIKRWKETVIEEEQEIQYEYIFIADYNAPGYTKIDSYMVGKYDTAYDENNIVVSMTGMVPKTEYSKANFRNKAKAKGTKWSLLDWHWFDLQDLYLVEYADYNSESKLGHGNIYYDTVTSLLEEESTNRMVVSSVPSGIYVGKTISIGTGGGNFSIARSRQVTEINDYDENGITGKEIVFDGTQVNLTTESKMWGSPQISGVLDSFGNKSGCLVSDMYHPVTYRGIENIFGNVWQHIDGINIKDRQTYVCYDRTKYANDKFDDGYEEIGYANASTSDTYIREVGYDEDNQLIALPIVTSGSSSTYLCDAYWSSTGNRILCVGGSANTNGSLCGLFASGCSYASSDSRWHLGARLLIHTS